MARKEINPTLKLALDLGPVILFFAGYVLFRDRSVTFGGTEYSGFVAVTAAFVPICLLYTSPSPRDRQKSRMPSSA